MKKYSKPAMIIEALNVEEMIAMSLPIGEGTINGNNADAKGRRGVWGDLWYDDVEEE